MKAPSPGSGCCAAYCAPSTSTPSTATGLDPALLQALPRATIDDAAKARVVVTLTGDLREELPILFLRLRESAVRYQRTIVELAFGASALRSVADVSLPVRPGEAHLVAQALVDGVLPQGGVFDAGRARPARETSSVTAKAWSSSSVDRTSPSRPRSWSAPFEVLATEFSRATFLPALRRANLMGALDMGLGPRLRPGRGFDAERGGRDTAGPTRGHARR